MGYRVSWIARSGTSVEELLKISRRTPSGERHEFPDIGFYLLEISAAADGPWAVLIADGTDHFAELDATAAQSLSNNGNETLYFWCSDTVMATELKCFKNGVLVWSIVYDCNFKSGQPAIEGDIPAIVHDLLANLRRKQLADPHADHLYDLTAEVGRRLLGFRHDVDLEGDDPEPFLVLAR